MKRPGMSVPIDRPPITSNVDISPSQNNNVGTNANLRPDSSTVERIEGSNPVAYTVKIPKKIRTGQQFPVTIQGQNLMVTCPLNARPGMMVRVVPPPPPTNAHLSPYENYFIGSNADQGGRRVAFVERMQCKLKYGKEGWTRTVRATDLKFQWIQMDDNRGDINWNQRFNFQNSAYVRQWEFCTQDYSFKVTLVPASEAVLDSNIRLIDGTELVTYSDLANAQAKNFEDKVQWLQYTCDKLRAESGGGHRMIPIRRQYLCRDSIDAVMSLSREDLRKIWRFDFVGEMEIDARGLTREWFELVCNEILDPDIGLWMRSKESRVRMTINPASGTYPWMQ